MDKLKVKKIYTLGLIGIRTKVNFEKHFRLLVMG